jgi:hypothetical protein
MPFTSVCRRFLIVAGLIVAGLYEAGTSIAAVTDHGYTRIVAGLYEAGTSTLAVTCGVQQFSQKRNPSDLATTLALMIKTSYTHRRSSIIIIDQSPVDSLTLPLRAERIWVKILNHGRRGETRKRVNKEWPFCAEVTQNVRGPP